MTNSPNSNHAEDVELVQACLKGDGDAFGIIRDKYHRRLMAHLVSRGGSETEASDLLADLWGECAAGREDRDPLFIKYHGRCGLYTWLVTVATHRLVDLKRRQKFQGILPAANENEEANNFDLLPGRAARDTEAGLMDLMGSALREAMAQTEPQVLILLQLVYLQGVMQREAARMFGWHESKVSRVMDQAMREIAERTLRNIKRVDPWLELSWEDFVDLCSAGGGSGFSFNVK